MKSTTLSLAAALALAAFSPSYAADQTPSAITGVKIVVKNFDKAVEFYTKVGLKVGVPYNATEHEMLSGDSQPPRLILVLDEAGKRVAGGSSLMINVPDCQAIAKALRDAGYPGIGEPKSTPRSMILSVKDPDGNAVEMLSPPQAR